MPDICRYFCSVVFPFGTVVPGESTTVASMMAPSASVPLAPQETGLRSDISQMAPTVPLAPLPDQSAPLPDPSMPPTNASTAPIAPMPDSSSMNQANPSPVQPETSAIPSTTTTTTMAPPGSVPLAPFPSDSSAQAQKGSASSFVIFNVSVYTVISILIASIF